ncbi:MAG: low molecular weight protein-tyrosine-phosphatase [Flavobacteriaceae bacterium]
MKTKILMVCLGNICRSPLAEGILRSKLDADKFIIDSAGTGNWHAGEKPDPRTIKVAQKFGLDISSQRARQFKPQDFDAFDYIFVMDASNKDNILKLTSDETHKQKVKLILNELFENENVDVPDPYHGGDRDFEHVFKLLDEACTIVAEKLKN